MTLSAMKKDNILFDFDYVKEFPILGPSEGIYFSATDKVNIFFFFLKSCCLNCLLY
jgi:hypothetical protein